MVMFQQADTKVDGEDRWSFGQRIEAMRPNLDIIRQYLQKVQEYKTHFIQQHTTAEVFPCLSQPW